MQFLKIQIFKSIDALIKEMDTTEKVIGEFGGVVKDMVTKEVLGKWHTLKSGQIEVKWK
jgi:hypothetical protein|tara:strand:+ start:291 stop:467 length:177 start_codon:yes stop_codon:yes gene_type:complete